MKLAPELREVIAAPVSGREGGPREGEVHFGNWTATAPTAFDSRHWSWEALLPESRSDQDLRVDVATHAFEFQLRSAGDSAVISMAQCVARGRFGVHTEYRGRVTDETTVALPGYPRIDCKFTGGLDGRLSLRPEFLTQRDSGLVRYGERLWNVQSVNNLASQRSSFPLARFGYEFRSGGEVVAAVETAGRGRVWLSPALPREERDQLAMAMAALLYYGTLLEEADS